MRDLVFVVVTVGFFVLAGAYVTFCDRIVRSDDATGAGPGPDLDEAGAEVGSTQAPAGPGRR